MEEPVKIFLTKGDRDISPAEIDPSRPRMFIFSGSGLTAEKKHEAYAVHDSVEQIMKAAGIPLGGIEFYGSYYSCKGDDDIVSFNAGRKEASPYSEEMAAAIFYPLLEKDGKRASADEAAEAFGKVMLRGHCMGAYVIEEIGAAVRGKMAELGYTPEETAKIMARTKSLVSGSPVLFNQSEAGFQTHAYVNLSDKTTRNLGGVNAQMEELSGLKADAEELQAKVVPLNSGGKALVLNRLDVPDWEYVSARLKADKPGLSQEENEAAALQKRKKMKTGHAFSCLMWAVNLEDSPFMQGAKQQLVSLFGGAIKDSLAARPPRSLGVSPNRSASR